MHYLDRRFDHAERLLERSLALLERRSDQRKTQAACLSDLGVVYLASGKMPNAADALLRSLALAEELLGPDHIQVARTLGHLSKAYRNRLHYAEAERLLNRSLAIREKSQPSDQSELATGLNELGTLYRNPRTVHASRGPLRTLQPDLEDRRRAGPPGNGNQHLQHGASVPRRGPRG